MASELNRHEFSVFRPYFRRILPNIVLIWN